MVCVSYMLLQNHLLLFHFAFVVVCLIVHSQEHWSGACRHWVRVIGVILPPKFLKSMVRIIVRAQEYTLRLAQICETAAQPLEVMIKHTDLWRRWFSSLNLVVLVLSTTTVHLWQNGCYFAFWFHHHGKVKVTTVHNLGFATVVIDW